MSQILITKTIAVLDKEIRSFKDAILARENAINRLRIVGNGISRKPAKAVKATKPSKRKPMSKTARARIAEAQRKRWAKQKATAKK